MTNNKWIAVFPGQGSQHVGMAKDLYQHSSKVRERFEEASDAIHVNLKELCFDGPSSDLTLTENTQPCLLLSSLCALEVTRREIGFEPSVVAGHSLGEYTALVAAGAIPFSTAIQWVRERGIAMQKAVPAGAGTMAAILGLDDDRVVELCQVAHAQAFEKRASQLEESPVDVCVEPANMNAPGQVVIAGSTDGVLEALSLLKTDDRFSGGKGIPLQVSAPFHCKLMEPARDRMGEIFSSARDLGSLHFPYVPNSTARISNESGTILEFLIEQVVRPVLWRQSMTGLLHQGFNHMVEFGPGKVLSGLMKRISASADKQCPTFSVADTQQLKTFETYYADSSSSAKGSI